MKKRDIKRLFKDYPRFKEWVMADPARQQEMKKSSAGATQLFKRWSEKSTANINFYNISEKTKRASEMLASVQSVMDLLNDYAKKEITKD